MGSAPPSGPRRAARWRWPSAVPPHSYQFHPKEPFVSARLILALHGAVRDRARLCGAVRGPALLGRAAKTHTARRCPRRPASRHVLKLAKTGQGGGVPGPGRGRAKQRTCRACSATTRAARGLRRDEKISWGRCAVRGLVGSDPPFRPSQSCMPPRLFTPLPELYFSRWHSRVHSSGGLAAAANSSIPVKALSEIHS